jgi:hypothetical protein
MLSMPAVRGAFVACAVALVAGSLAAVAGATGGLDIASAPPLPVGATVFGGQTDQVHEFYRVQLAAGDKLTIDYTPLPPSQQYQSGSLCLRIFKPSITDFTFRDNAQRPAAQDCSQGKHEFNWRPPQTGNWIMEVCEFVYELSGTCDLLNGFKYQLIAAVHTFTSVTVKAPPLVIIPRSGMRRYPVSGEVNGATGGTIALQQSVRGRWYTVRSAAIGSDGRFSTFFTVKHRPLTSKRWTFRVLYPGDGNHLASSGIFRVPVSN